MPAVDRDGCCVETEPLCNLVRRFVEQWLETRTSRKGRYPSEEGYDEALEPVGPYTWLAFDTGLPESEVRKLRNPRRFPLTELRVAEMIINSIGEPAMLYDGTLLVLPNPVVPEERRPAECCGESRRRVWFQLEQGGQWMCTVSPVPTPGRVRPAMVIAGNPNIASLPPPLPLAHAGVNQGTGSQRRKTASG